MSDPPAPAAPQYSPDGRWWWDGTRWVPVQQPYAPGPTRGGGMPVWGWVAIGCVGVLLLLGVVGAVAGALFAATTLGRLQCPPSDFPVPASSQRTGWYVHESGSLATCDTSWTTSTSPPDVSGFYRRRLNEGGWRLTSYDSNTGLIFFERLNSPGEHGQVELLAHGLQTDIQLHLESNRGTFGR